MVARATVVRNLLRVGSLNWCVAMAGVGARGRELSGSCANLGLLSLAALFPVGVSQETCWEAPSSAS